MYPPHGLLQSEEVRMRRRIRRLVLAVAAVIAALSINVMSLQAGGGGGEEGCGFCASTECSSQDVVALCIQMCDDLPDECEMSSPMCSPGSPGTWIECEGGGGHET